MSKEKDTVIRAKTFTCNYVKKEDRLLLTINYKDISTRVDFWVTRSFLLKLLPYFFDYTSVDTSEVKDPKMVGQKTAEQKKQKNSIDPTDSSTFMLTQKEPVLLESVDFTKLKNNQTRIVFKNLEKKIFCVAHLDADSVSNIIKLITNSAPVSEWGIYNFL